ncbi:MAG: LytTR family DNA-binding domain-containing protein [Cyclobacteriaceae bacterium]
MPLVLKIAIIEDEASAVRRLSKELSQLKDISFEIIATLDSVSEACQWLSQEQSPDLIFMDIQLSDGISFEIFKRVAVPCPVIFVTAYDEFALQAFKVNSLDYLLKPIDPRELRSAIDKYLSQQKDAKPQSYLNQLLKLAHQFKPETYRSSFLVSFRQKMLLINLQEVAYFYVKERAVFLKRKDGKEYVIEFFLDELTQQLDPALFYRANRQFLVARSSIFEIEPYFTGRLLLKVTPEPPSPIIISKEKISDFKKWADY